MVLIWLKKVHLIIDIKGVSLKIMNFIDTITFLRNFLSGGHNFNTTHI